MYNAIWNISRNLMEWLRHEKGYRPNIRCFFGIHEVSKYVTHRINGVDYHVCKRCGKTLKHGGDAMITIADACKVLRRCYECRKKEACCGCPYNGFKLEIIELLKDLGK